jgi:hypothetical protein
MKRPSMMKVLAPGYVLAAAMSMASSARAQSPPELKAGGDTAELATSDGVFQTYGSGMAEMQARLADPQQRAKMREDQRQSIVDTHYGVADSLQLDAASFDRLIDLLTDQQMERSEYFYKEFATRPMPTAPIHPSKRMQAEAERVTKQIEALREVLGQEKLERYQKLQPSLGQRRQLRQLDARLGDADKLDSTQQDRLVELLHEQFMASINRIHARRRSAFLGEVFNSPSREALQRSSLLETIASNEDLWRELPESNRQLRERVAGFLTERQLTVLEQMQAEELAIQQERIEQMRVQAGLSATIPKQPQVIELSPATVERDVKLSLRVSVNDESPRYLTTVVSSGKSVSLKISKDLILEATPVVFENDAYKLRVDYFETGTTGRRLIGNMGESGTVKPLGPDPRSIITNNGGGSTVITGSKGYAIELSTLVEAT